MYGTHQRREQNLVHTRYNTQIYSYIQSYSTVLEIEGEGCRGRVATLLTVDYSNQHLLSTVTKVVLASIFHSKTNDCGVVSKWQRKVDRYLHPAAI